MTISNESRYAPETRDHVVRVRMRGGALTLALSPRCTHPAVQSVSTVLRPKNYKYYIMHDLASSPATCTNFEGHSITDGELKIALLLLGIASYT